MSAGCFSVSCHSRAEPTSGPEAAVGRPSLFPAKPQVDGGLAPVPRGQPQPPAGRVLTPEQAGALAGTVGLDPENGRLCRLWTNRSYTRQRRPSTGHLRRRLLDRRGESGEVSSASYRTRWSYRGPNLIPYWGDGVAVRTAVFPSACSHLALNKQTTFWCSERWPPMAKSVRLQKGDRNKGEKEGTLFSRVPAAGQRRHFWKYFPSFPEHFIVGSYHARGSFFHAKR